MGGERSEGGRRKWNETIKVYFCSVKKMFCIQRLRTQDSQQHSHSYSDTNIQQYTAVYSSAQGCSSE